MYPGISPEKISTRVNISLEANGLYGNLGPKVRESLRATVSAALFQGVNAAKPFTRNTLDEIKESFPIAFRAQQTGDLSAEEFNRFPSQDVAWKIMQEAKIELGDNEIKLGSDQAKYLIFPKKNQKKSRFSGLYYNFGNFTDIRSGFTI
ncbi:MAG: hypothetical protein PVG35_21665 [Desulfobacterales bacterium]|jgi:hypothetical protein